FTECRSEDTVDQPDKHVTEAEGRSVTLQCKYKTDSAQEDLFWYIQRANDFPKYILRRSKYGGENGTEFQERFHSELSSNSVPLTIKDLRVSDSAVYYCALKPTVTGNTSDLYKNLLQ
ncbi:T-cell receptor alpha chain V region RL-5, partial [Anabarilius grahami]